MTEYTQRLLINKGYEILNAKITDISLTMRSHCSLTLEISLEGDGWGVTYGGWCIGKGYLGADEFSGSPRGIEYIMRIMDVIGIESLEDAKGKYVRVASKGWEDTVKIIGNIIEDKWFDSASFFNDYKDEKEEF